MHEPWPAVNSSSTRTRASSATRRRPRAAPAPHARCRAPPQTPCAAPGCRITWPTPSCSARSHSCSNVSVDRSRFASFPVARLIRYEACAAVGIARAPYVACASRNASITAGSSGPPPTAATTASTAAPHPRDRARTARIPGELRLPPTRVLPGSSGAGSVRANRCPCTRSQTSDRPRPWICRACRGSAGIDAGACGAGGRCGREDPGDLLRNHRSGWARCASRSPR